MVVISKWIVLLFGVFLIFVGFLMLFKPAKAREILRKAGSTNFINYTEITLRMIPAIGLIFSSEISKYPSFFSLLGGFMLLTSLVLYFMPRRLHHQYSLTCAEILKPLYFQFISPVSFLFGAFLMYCLV
jgi:uncharacterized membrane protein YfcA